MSPFHFHWEEFFLFFQILQPNNLNIQQLVWETTKLKKIKNYFQKSKTYSFWSEIVFKPSNMSTFYF